MNDIDMSGFKNQNWSLEDEDMPSEIHVKVQNVCTPFIEVYYSYADFSLILTSLYVQSSSPDFLLKLCS